MEQIMKLLGTLSDICSNPGYATIIGAVIAAVAGIGIAVYNKRKKSDSGPTVIVTPPPSDPLSKLKADTAGVQKIDNQKFGSREYVETLAARMELLKNKGSKLDVFYEEEDGDD